MSLPIDNGIYGVLADIFVVASAIGCIYLLVASVIVLRFPPKRAAPRFRPAPVSILKPLHGAEPGLARRLASFCDQAYGAPIQLVCGVQDRSDPAAGIVRAVAASRPGQSVELVTDPNEQGCNRKIANLANMLPLARHEVIVMADSDIEVEPDYLANIAAELQRQRVGAVTCLYYGLPGPGHWSQHSALSVNAHFLPNVVAALRLGIARPCFGATIAMHRKTMARIGGLQRFSDCLADDFAIGEAVRAIGLEVAIPAFSIGHVCFERSLRGLLAHELRAARTVKGIDPVGYFGSILTHPFPLALIAALIGGGDAWLLAGIALACRAVLCLCVEQTFALARQPYWLLPIRDLISFGVFVASYGGSTVTWKGSRYRVAPDGRLLPDRSRSK